MKIASKEVVLRITRHPLDTDREAFLKGVYGFGLRIVTEDIPYGDDPVATVRALIERTEAGNANVVAVEAQAPFPVLIRLVDARFSIPLIRAAFERGPDGRAIVSGKDERGRDLLKFSHYEELVRIEFETRRLK